MSRKKITYVETGERFIDLSKEAMQNIRLWMLLDVWRFDRDAVAEYENEEVKFSSFEDFASYLKNDLDGIFDNEDVYDYIRNLCNTETDKKGYECVTYVRGHRPVELDYDPITWLKNQEVA